MSASTEAPSQPLPIEMRHALEERIPGVVTALARQAATLRAVGRLAPSEAAERRLVQLAEEDDWLSQEVRSVLARWDLPTGPASVSPPPVQGTSHWARLRQVLDQHLDSRLHLREAIALTQDLAGDLGETVSRVLAGEERHLRELRDLIARADPQALD